MAATKTRADLVQRALERLGVAAAGQSVSAEDSDLVDRQIDPLCEELAGRGVITIVDTATFESSVFLALADVLAFTAAPDFAVTPAELAGKGIDGTPDGSAERRLRKIKAVAPLDAPVQVEYL